tara:strand:- start:122 stop:313 length:192 start_codon:yes stop_codon:yes gene_type:complete
MVMKSFEYDKSKSYQDNYYNWKFMNDDERSSFGLRIYSDKEGRKIFDSMYKKFNKENKDVDGD